VGVIDDSSSNAAICSLTQRSSPNGHDVAHDRQQVLVLLRGEVLGIRTE
jgi:hypothetical protein